ncbi:hypothetical protein [Salinicoccus roseus]|uniref:Uncharacterized protein n=1 Tax=Salinicoccus roseus TaxID=45670 RepID=A0A0C2DJ18_9STAP|nr:hypothetical protein [Salinicoccus roseus]KIH69953.1 hypothetical protein SN16_10610 [Salinicoccus roseus]MDB0581251.1 hypothetical protein [Salinicoccus roseus]
MFNSIIWLIIGIVAGVAVSIIFNDYIDKANKYWMLFTGKAVRGTYVSGKIHDPRFDERNPLRPMDSVIDDGWWKFELYMPYKNMNEYHAEKNPEGMDIEKSEGLIKEAILQKYDRDYHGKYVNMNVATRPNQIIPVENLDMRLPK